MIPPLLSAAAAVVAIGVHLVVLARSSAMVRRARELPDRPAGRAMRIPGRTRPFAIGAAATAAVAARALLTDDGRGGPAGLWRSAAAGFALGFNAVAFLIEYVGVVAQRRPLAEIRDFRSTGRGQATADILESSTDHQARP